MAKTREIGRYIGLAFGVTVVAVVFSRLGRLDCIATAARGVAITAGSCLAVLSIAAVFASAGERWKDADPVKIATERVERACDAVIAMLAFLIPASAVLATWLHDAEDSAYVKLLADQQLRLARVSGVSAFPHPGLVNTTVMLSVVCFVIVLAFTMYIRFNFMLGVGGADVEIGKGAESRNIQVIYWATAVMVFMFFGLILLAVPIFVVMLSRH